MVMEQRSELFGIVVVGEVGLELELVRVCTLTPGEHILEQVEAYTLVEVEVQTEVDTPDYDNPKQPRAPPYSKPAEHHSQLDSVLVQESEIHLQLQSTVIEP